jgi:hypothetical protein
VEDTKINDNNPAPAADEESKGDAANEQRPFGATLKIAGTRSWNWMIADQSIGTLPLSFDSKRRKGQYQAVFDALNGMEPRDELEGGAAARGA